MATYDNIAVLEGVYLYEASVLDGYESLRTPSLARTYRIEIS